MTTLPISHQPRPFVSYLDPIRMLRSLWGHRELTLQFAARKIQQQYKGQALGIAWSILDPLLLLATYTFVFGIVFQGKAGDQHAEGGIARYALEVFSGVLVFTLFRETVGPAPMLVINQRNFVKKVVYPLETLPISQLLVTLFNTCVGLTVWIIGYSIFSSAHVPSPRLLLMPVVILPVVLIALGLSWILSSLGVFLRDLRTPVQSVMQMLFFMSAIFYTLDRVPQPYRSIIALNPLAQMIEDSRNVMFGRGWPNWIHWEVSLVAGVLLCVVGYAFFMKSKRAFADVI